MKHSILLCLLSCAALVSCKNDKPEPQTIQIPITINGNIGQNAPSELLKEMGVYVVNQTSPGVNAPLQSKGNYLDNVKFTRLNGIMTPQESVYWVDNDTKADFYCYSPYSTSEISDVNAHIFAVKKDQNSNNGYVLSDFLWSKTESIAPTEEALSLIKSHLLSAVIINVKAGEGFSQDEFEKASKSVVVYGQDSVKIDLATGKSTSFGTVQPITPKLEDGTYMVILPCQRLIKEDSFIKIMVDGSPYSGSIDYELLPGKMLKMTLTLAKSSTIADCRIEDLNR